MIENGWQSFLFMVAGGLLVIVYILYRFSKEFEAREHRVSSRGYTDEQKRLIREGTYIEEMIIEHIPMEYQEFVLNGFKEYWPVTAQGLEEFVELASSWFVIVPKNKLYAIVLRDGKVIYAKNQSCLDAIGYNFIGDKWRDNVAVIEDGITSVAQATSSLSRFTVTAEMKVAVFETLKKRNKMKAGAL